MKVWGITHLLFPAPIGRVSIVAQQGDPVAAGLKLTGITDLLIWLVDIDFRVMPNLFPELSWFRDTPVPEGLVIIQGQAVLLVDLGHKIIDLG
jgi:hypothetical protein